MVSNRAGNELRRRIVGRFLKHYREQAEITQGEVARALSYASPQFVSNWERGLAMPPLSVLPKVARILKFPPKRMIEMLHQYQEEMLTLQKREIIELFRGQAARS